MLWSRQNHGRAVVPREVTGVSSSDAQITRRLCSRLFYFGEYTTHCYGTLACTPSGEVLAGFGNEREAFWRLNNDCLEFLYCDGSSVTSRLELVLADPMVFHGASIGVSNRLYLREAIALEWGQDSRSLVTSWPTVIINTAPKSGTYWLQRTCIELGFLPTDLHLGNADVDDHRGLVRDASIHRAPWLRRIPLSTAVLSAQLPPGSVSVAHINDPGVLEVIAGRGCFLLLVVRDLRAIVWSLYRFKLAAVDPLDEQDRDWRTQAGALDRFMGFLAYHLDRDLAYVANCFRAFARQRDVPVFRYEDLLQGRFSATSEAYLQRHLHACGGSEVFRAALAATCGQPTPTLSTALPAVPAELPEERAEIRRRIDAFVAESQLGEVNALFGYR